MKKTVYCIECRIRFRVLILKQESDYDDLDLRAPYHGNVIYWCLLMLFEETRCWMGIESMTFSNIHCVFSIEQRFSYKKLGKRLRISLKHALIQNQDPQDIKVRHIFSLFPMRLKIFIQRILIKKDSVLYRMSYSLSSLDLERRIRLRRSGLTCSISRECHLLVPSDVI